MIDSLERRVILWWWNALGAAKNADSVYRLSLTAVQPALREFFYQSVPHFMCVMVKDRGLRGTKKDCGKPGREEEDEDGGLCQFCKGTRSRAKFWLSNGAALEPEACSGLSL